MADPKDRRKHQEQHQQQHCCIICSGATSENMPVCQYCLHVKIHSQDVQNKLPSGATWISETTWKPKGKKKKRHNKRKHGTEQNKNPNETLKVELDGMKDKDLSEAERKGEKPRKEDTQAKDGAKFGEGWWKLNSNNSKTESSEMREQTRLKYKDFYSDSEDDLEDMFRNKTDVYEKSVTNSASASIKKTQLEEAGKVQIGELHTSKATHTALKARLEYKDVYDNSGDDIEDTSSKAERVASTNKSSRSNSDSVSAASFLMVKDMSGLKLEEKIEHKQCKEEKKEPPSDQKSPTWGKCSHCKKEGNLLKCSRCKLSSYCDRQCQKSDYPQHKLICRSVSLEEGSSGLKSEKTEHKKSKEEKKETPKDQPSSTWGKCSHCKKEGYVLSCSRCKLSSYCDKQCQKNGYPQHKEICRRKEKFNLVQSEIPDALKMPFIKEMGGFLLSQFLRDLPDEYEYACGERMIVMAEIIGPYFHIFRYGVVIRDLIGEQTHIIFYSKSDVFTDQTSSKPVNYPMPRCLRPGNFILLLDTHFHHFLDGTIGIRIDSLSENFRVSVVRSSSHLPHALEVAGLILGCVVQTMSAILWRPPGGHIWRQFMICAMFLAVGLPFYRKRSSK